MTVAKWHSIVCLVCVNCYLVVTQMLPRWYSCVDGLYISYISIWYDYNNTAAVISVPITESKQKYMCAGLRHVHSNPRLKKWFKKILLTEKQTNQIRGNLSNTLKYWYFIQSKSAKGAETHNSVPSVFTSVNISSTTARGQETSESWNKRLALRFVLKKDRKSQFCYIVVNMFYCLLI